MDRLYYDQLMLRACVCGARSVGSVQGIVLLPAHVSLLALSLACWQVRFFSDVRFVKLK